MRGTLLFLFLVFVVSFVVSAQGQSWCGSQTIYFQHNESTSPLGYEELINYPSGNTEVVENVTLINTAGWVLIDSYITPENIFSGTTEVERGLRRYRTYHYVDSAVGTTQANYTAFIRFADGYERYIYSVVTDDINDLSVNEYLTSYAVQTDYKLNHTDREVIKVYGKTTHSSPIKLYWVYQGSTHTSHLESGYFVCDPTHDTFDLGQDYSVAIMYGLVGGIIGALLVARYFFYKQRK